MRALITGGAGFIGIQTADRLLGMGQEAVLLDNLSRIGGRQNLAWLKERHGDYPFEEADVRDFATLTAIVARYQPLEVVFHFAAQVAVTSSVENPKEDFDINALGTLNVLESIRQSGLDPVFIYSSTNKVYGKQVRDLPYIDDLIDGMLQAIDQVDQTQGNIYNMAGGVENSLSI
jgi:CDP-paratose 2-epimerase